jgi:hypothetical protein
MQQSINARQEPQCGIKLGIFVLRILCKISQTNWKMAEHLIYIN